MILVTGATGLVGGNLAWHLLKKHEKIRAIRRTSSDLHPLYTIFSFYTDRPEEYLLRIEWVIADILDQPSLTIALKGIHTIYHCAAVVSLGKGGSLLTNTNVAGTQNIVKAALQENVKRFCFVSSIAACGDEPKTQFITEQSPWNEQSHRSLYSRSKYEAEREVWNGIKEGLQAVIVNPGVILGISGTNTGSAQLFNQVQKGLPFYTNGGTGYIDVRDVVTAMILLTESDITNERFILVSNNCSNKEILSWIADGYKKRRPFINLKKNILLPVAFLSEKLAKLTKHPPIMDRSTARTALGRKYYSSDKFLAQTHYQFRDIQSAIKDICQFTNNHKTNS